jgi:uncharacterized protein
MAVAVLASLQRVRQRQRLLHNCVSGSSAMTLQFGIVAIAAFVAGVQNALAGGGSFLTFPALLLTGLGPVAANITSTVALFPGQVTTGLAGRGDVIGLPRLGFRALFLISLVGGAAGAVLLLNTPEHLFSALVPWLVLFATLVFAWGSFRHRSGGRVHRVPPAISAALQLAIAVYGGYFGGGIGILMLAALTLSGMAVRNAGATKNALAGVMNVAAVLIFASSQRVAWAQAAVMAIAAMAGGQLGAWMFRRVNERLLRFAIIIVGLALTVGLFARQHS